MTPAARAFVVFTLFICAACRSAGVAPRAATGAPTAGNHPPRVRALCEPCTIAAGGRVTLKADAQDADGDALTYTWTAAAGSPASASAREATWTAPPAAGPVPITVRVSDGKGGVATDVVTIAVVR
jgi:hypothetical protein